ncbi:MAG TPA: response regulator [Acidimicrobiales bacterium]|nr:response regulator [Acidimicrobiales bacterium]
MPDIVLASDEEWVRDEIRSAVSGVPDARLREVTSGTAVLTSVMQALPDLVVVDMQIGNMGAMAVCLDLRLEESGGRIGHVPVLMLVDRRADVFLARRSGAEGWIVKPLDPMRLRKALRALLAGDTYHDESYKPEPVA